MSMPRARFGWYLQFTLVLLLLTILGIGSGSAWAESRMWTDRSGQTMNAEFVRVTGSDAIFKRGTRVVRIPLRRLSEADQEFINGSRNGSEARYWTVNGRKLKGSFKSYADGEATIQVRSSDRTLAVDVLSDDDREHIRQQLSEDGKLAELPDGDPIKGSGEPLQREDPMSSQRGETDDDVEADANTDADADVDDAEVAEDEDPAAEPRTWTDNKGRTVEAAFVRIDNGGSVVLRRTKDDKEMAIPMIKLAFKDRAAAIREQSQMRMAESRKTLDRAKQEREEFADANKATPPPNSVASNSSPRSPAASNSAFDNHRQMMDQMKKEREERRERMRQESEEQRLAGEAQRKESQDQMMANQSSFPHVPAPHAPAPRPPVTYSSPPPSPRVPDYASNSSSAAPDVYVEEFVCGGCNKTLPSHIGAGDHCPYCDVFFEYEEGVDGDRNYAPLHKNKHDMRLMGKAIAVFLIGIGGWFSRKAKR